MKNNNILNQLEQTLEEYFGKKAPQLPENVKDIIVKIAPYLAIISVVISIPAVLALIGLGTFATGMSAIAGTTAYVPAMWTTILLLIPSIVLNALSIPGLFARSMKGWRYVYWGELLSIVYSLVNGNIISAIIGGAIGLYIVFQVKNHYK